MELFCIDKKNYSNCSNINSRTAYRGIVNINGKLAMIYSTKYKDYKFPSGGTKSLESLKDTLVRELKKEAGLITEYSSIKEQFYVTEIQKDEYKDNTLFIHKSIYFTCMFKENVIEQSLDDYEKEHGFILKYVSASEAKKNNEDIILNNDIKEIPWIIRETRVLKYLKEIGY